MAEEGVTVEVGPRTAPSIEHLRDDLLQGDKIIYLEKRGGWAYDLGKVKISEKEIIIQSDGSKIPMPDSTVATIYAKDLFGSRGMLAMEPENSKFSFSLEENIGVNFGPEWFRVLRSGGKAIVVETASPTDRNALKGEFVGAGFRLLEEHLGTDLGKVFKEKKIFGRMGERALGEDAYALVLEKPER